MKLGLGIFFILILLTSNASAIAYRADTSKAVEAQSKKMIYSYELEERIAIFYAGNDLVIAGTAVSLYNSLRIVYNLLI